jgi:hypothetical protein
MTGPAELQAEFARAVLDPNAEVPLPLTRQSGGTPARRFGVYRNNVYASLIDVLAARFPVTARLVGEAFFRAMARLYVEKAPPGSPVLLRYGAGLADFIAEFPPAAPVPYLGDVARLEWAWHAAYHAADAESLPLAALAQLRESAARATLALHPSLHVVRSDYAVVTIWQLAAREDQDEPARLPAKGEDAMVVRPRLEVEARRLPEGGAVFVQALKGGARLQAAAERALEAAPGFDLEANLAGLMTSGAIVGASAKS